MTTTYTYSITEQHADQHGVLRDGMLRDLEPGEMETLSLGPFQGAADLPDETEFARGTDANGNPVAVYRSAE